MTATSVPAHDRMLTDLEAEVRPLVGAVRVALAEVMAAAPHDAAGRFLALAPVDACVRLADVWAVAEAVGVPTAAVRDRFGPEDQFLIDIVTSVYTAARPGQGPADADLPELARLLDETGAG